MKPTSGRRQRHSPKSNALHCRRVGLVGWVGLVRLVPRCVHGCFAPGGRAGGSAALRGAAASVNKQAAAWRRLAPCCPASLPPYTVSASFLHLPQAEGGSRGQEQAGENWARPHAAPLPPATAQRGGRGGAARRPAAPPAAIRWVGGWLGGCVRVDLPHRQQQSGRWAVGFGPPCRPAGSSEVDGAARVLRSTSRSLRPLSPACLLIATNALPCCALFTFFNNPAPPAPPCYVFCSRGASLLCLLHFLQHPPIPQLCGVYIRCCGGGRCNEAGVGLGLGRLWPVAGCEAKCSVHQSRACQGGRVAAVLGTLSCHASLRQALS